jgi:hypothetical protein
LYSLTKNWARREQPFVEWRVGATVDLIERRVFAVILAQALGHLPGRVSTLRVLRDGISLEIVAEFGAAHHVLLASKLAKNASTIHGAIHIPVHTRLAEHALRELPGSQEHV